MKRRLMELISNIKTSADDTRTFADIIATELIANGVIVPPCKVGDTVYRISKRRGVWCILPREVVSITYRLDYLYRPIFEIFSTETDRLGKTVFLTREKAEKALAERGER